MNPFIVLVDATTYDDADYIKFFEQKYDESKQIQIEEKWPP